MTPTLTFTCNICGEPSNEICIYCTKDACANHICEKCHKCSDCCECEIRLQENPPEPIIAEPSAEVEEPVVEAAEEPPAEPVAAAEEPPPPPPPPAPENI